MSTKHGNKRSSTSGPKLRTFAVPDEGRQQVANGDGYSDDASTLAALQQALDSVKVSPVDGTIQIDSGWLAAASESTPGSANDVTSLVHASGLRLDVELTQSLAKFAAANEAAPLVQQFRERMVQTVKAEVNALVSILKERFALEVSSSNQQHNLDSTRTAVDDAEKVNVELREKLKQGDAKLEELKATLEKSHEEKQQLEGLIRNRKDQLQKWDSRVQKKQAQADQLKAALEEKKAQLEEKKAQLEQIQAKLDASEKSSKHLETELSQLSLPVPVKNNLLSAAKQQELLRKSTSKLETLKRRSQRVEQKQQEKTENLMDVIRTLREENEALSKQLENSEKIKSVAGQEHKVQDEIMRDLSAEIHSLTQENIALEVQVRALKEAAAKRGAGLHQQLSELDQENHLLQEENARVSERVQTLQRENTSLRRQATSVEKQRNVKAEEELADLKGKFDQAKKENSRLALEAAGLSTLAAENADLKQSVKRLRDEIETLKQRVVAAMQKENSRLALEASEFSTVAAENVELKQSVKRLREESEILKQRVVAAAQEGNSRETSSKQLHAENMDLRRQLSQRSKEQSAEISRLLAKQKKLAEEKNQIDSVRAENAELKRQLLTAGKNAATASSHSDAELEALRTENSDLRRRASARAAKVQDLTRQLEDLQSTQRQQGGGGSYEGLRTPSTPHNDSSLLDDERIALRSMAKSIQATLAMQKQRLHSRLVESELFTSM